jgi:23S rRNA U2552 (ribose-2'-O)-methylase RlmE/FtsJ
MSIFKIPNNIINLNDSNIKLQFNKKEPIPIINNSISIYLKKIKDKIDDKPYEWNIHKKFTNIYEYIHTNININSSSISKIKPISRAFYKLIEIYITFDILNIYEKKNIKTFHFAEGPGGFIEATSFLRNNSNDKYYGTTLIEQNNKNIPIWKKSHILNNQSNIFIENCFDNTGNLYNPDNYNHILNNYYNSFDIVTADGGIDFSENFDKQELMAFKLILCEIFYSITVLKKGGTFILKLFDIFHKPTIQCVYLLSTIFNEVYITKPKTSRSGNSEKYIVCKDFNAINRDKLIKKFYKSLIVFNNIGTDFFIESFLNIPMQHIFMSKIQDINIILGNKQIKNILTTLKLINNNEKKSDKIKIYKNENIQKCILWCIKFDIPYNKKAKSNNIFLENRKLKN